VKTAGETAHVSWWPTFNIWATERGHGNIWTPDDEKWYIHQKSLIKQHKFKPITAMEWRRKLRQDRKTKAFWKRIDASCEAYLKEFGLEWSAIVNN